MNLGKNKVNMKNNNLFFLANRLNYVPPSIQWLTVGYDVSTATTFDQSRYQRLHLLCYGKYKERITERMAGSKTELDSNVFHFKWFEKKFTSSYYFS